MVRLKPNALDLGTDDVLLASKLLEEETPGLNPKPYTPGTHMETQKGPYKDYSPCKMGLYGFPCLFGGV